MAKFKWIDILYKLRCQFNFSFCTKANRRLKRIFRKDVSTKCTFLVFQIWKSIIRREETAAMRNMLNTAKLMEENEMLWKLKEMEYVEKIADKIGEITISGGGNVIGQLREIFVK